MTDSQIEVVEHIADLNNGHFNVFLNVLLSLFVTDDAKITRVSEDGNGNVPNSMSTSKRSRFEETSNSNRVVASDGSDTRNRIFGYTESA